MVYEGVDVKWTVLLRSICNNKNKKGLLIRFWFSPIYSTVLTSGSNAWDRFRDSTWSVIRSHECELRSDLRAPVNFLIKKSIFCHLRRERWHQQYKNRRDKVRVRPPETSSTGHQRTGYERLYSLYQKPWCRRYERWKDKLTNYFTGTEA